MEPASFTPFEPLSEAGPEMPSAPAPSARQGASASPAARQAPPAQEPELEPLSLSEGPDSAVAPLLLGTPPAPAAPAALAVPAAPAARAAPSPVAAPVAVAAPAMDRDFIARNQIVERYISGRLPIKGATDFERFCRDNPTVLDELGLPERVNAGLRLLEAAGKPEPWQEAPKKFWEKPHALIGLAATVLVLIVTLGVVWSGSSDKSHQISKLQKRVADQPLEPATATRTIRLLPSYKGGTNSPAVIIGGKETQLADLKIDMSRSQYRGFRVTIDRVDQGRVAILHNLLKDSNGHVRIALNSSALGPGNYQLTIEGLTWKGDPVPEAWLTIGIQR